MPRPVEKTSPRGDVAGDALASLRDERAASLSPPSTRIARGGVRGERSSLSRSGVGGASAISPPAGERVDRPPTPDPSAPLRGGRGEERTGDEEDNSTNDGKNPASVLPAPVGAIS